MQEKHTFRSSRAKGAVPRYCTLLSTSPLQQSHSSPLMSSVVFNQGSPYPVHVLPSNATCRRRTALQTARAISSTSLTDATAATAATTTIIRKGKGYRAKIHTRIQEHGKFYKSIVSRAASVLRSQSSTDAVLSRSTSSSGGGRVTPPSSSESTRISPTKSRQQANRPRLPSQRAWGASLYGFLTPTCFSAVPQGVVRLLFLSCGSRPVSSVVFR
jgi:hypothetical protein